MKLTFTVLVTVTKPEYYKEDIIIEYIRTRTACDI